jgi:hypothetical protein
MRGFATLLLLLVPAFSVTACIIEAPGPGPGPGHDRWCYWHPDR